MRAERCVVAKNGRGKAANKAVTNPLAGMLNRRKEGSVQGGKSRAAQRQQRRQQRARQEGESGVGPPKEPKVVKRPGSGEAVNEPPGSRHPSLWEPCPVW